MYVYTGVIVKGQQTPGVTDYMLPFYSKCVEGDPKISGWH